MCKVAQIRSCRLFTAAVALLWCTAAAAADGSRQTVNDSAQGGSRLNQIKPVTSDFDTDIDTRYRKDIQRRYAAQDLKMNNALTLVKDQKFKEAVQAAEAVRDELKLEAEFVKSEIVSARLAEAESLTARVRLAWGQERLNKANESFKKNLLTEARVLAGEAALISPALKKDVEALLKLCSASERNTKFQTMTSLNVANPKLATIRKEAKDLLTEAKVFFENKRYDQALDKVEQVYLRDPFNSEAVALAGQIYREFFTKGYYRHRADFEIQAAYTTWQWVEPVFEAPEVPKKITVMEKGDSRKAMSDKLRNSILPQFTWKKGDARGAIKRLSSQAKEYGIDIQDFTTREDAASLGTVTLDLNNVSVADVLRYISLMSGVKYRIEPEGVAVGTSIETLYDRKYDIQPHVKTMVYASVAPDSEKSGGGDEENNVFRKKSPSKESSSQSSSSSGSEEKVDKELKMLAAPAVTVTSEMFKEYLTKHGINFGEGSFVGWNSLSNSLTVKSTTENLDAISQLLREQNALQASLILVDAKCIEVSDNDMEELGFDWVLGDNLSRNMTNQGALKDTSKKGWMFGIGDNLRPDQEGKRGSMNPLRTGFMDGSSSSAFINNLNIFPMLFGSKTPFGSDVPVNVSLTINALNQNTRTETISAPKVVVLSGRTASAQLYKTHHFPSDWSEFNYEIVSSDGDGGNTYRTERPTPTFDDERDLGVKMTVTPTLTESGAINLRFNLSFTGVNGNDEYSFDFTGSFNGQPFSERFTVWKPVVTTREVDTDIDVYDGQTVLVGGSTDNRTVTRCDKVPFLGDLPLIGRLFQTQSEKAERRNVLIFVTARRLGADGAPVSSFNQGAPDFNR